MAKTPKFTRPRRGKVIPLTPDEQVEQATLERHVVAQEAAEKAEVDSHDAPAPESAYQARQRRLKDLRRG